MAITAKTEQVEFVRGHFELVFVGNLFLKFFNQGVLEFQDSAAFGAYHVIMMAVLVLVFVPFLSFPEIQFLGQPALG